MPDHAPSPAAPAPESTPATPLAARFIRAAVHATTGLWFGAMGVFVVTAVAAFGQTPRFEPELTAERWASVPADHEAASRIIAGSIVNQVIDAVQLTQRVCWVLLVIGVALLHTVWPRHTAGPSHPASLTRIALLVVLGACLTYGYFLKVDMDRLREEMYFAEPQAREVAEEAFQAHHKISERLGGVMMLMVLGVGVASPLTERRR